jgi:hypothetical protein
MWSVLGICFALYSSANHVDEPFYTTCLLYDAPVVFDAATCPGEVTTEAWDEDFMYPTCEVTID